MENNDKKLKILICVLVAIILVLASALAYYIFAKKDVPNNQNNQKIVEYQSADKKIKTVSKSNTEQYQKTYLKAKKAFEDYAEENELNTQYTFDGEYYVISNDIIVEITKVKEDDKYAIFEGYQPGTDYPKYVYLVNKSKKSIESLDETLSDGGNFIELKGKYYFFDAKHDYSDFIDIYSEDMQHLGYIGRGENVIYDNALYYIAYENNTIYLANTSGLKKQVLENFELSRIITEISRDDDTIDVKIYEEINGNEEVICSFQYIIYRDEVINLEFNHDFVDNNRLNKSLLVVEYYENAAWDNSLYGSAIFDDGSLYKWNYREGTDGSINEYFYKYDVDTPDGMKDFILDKGTRKMMIPTQRLEEIRDGINNLTKEEASYESSCLGADMGTRLIYVYQNGAKIKLGEDGDCVGYSDSENVARLLYIMDPYIDTSYYRE
jgi:hypothetical protein